MKKFSYLVLLLSLTIFKTSFGFEHAPVGAKAQADALWALIEQTRYDELPDFVAPSARDALTLLQPAYNSQVFVGDYWIMPDGRKKLIHGSGVIARVSYVMEKHAYSGIFDSGAPFGLLRLSLAKAPEKNSYIPGFSLMLFVDQHPPVTMLAMPSLNPQASPNIFLNDYVTAVPAPKWTLSGWLLGTFFNKGIKLLGFHNHDSRALSTADFVKVTAFGQEVNRPAKEPYSLIFSPSKEARNLLNGIRRTDDFRSILMANGRGRTLFQVYAKANKESVPELIGRIVMTSDFVASDFADNKLRIKHPEPVENLPTEGWFSYFRRR